jgi:3'-phosphoadenosine 5'-phosphosulfate sulfotransferase (PAPS reductase)/FAD synthetase
MIDDWGQHKVWNYAVPIVTQQLPSVDSVSQIAQLGGLTVLAVFASYGCWHLFRRINVLQDRESARLEKQLEQQGAALSTLIARLALITEDVMRK